MNKFFEFIGINGKSKFAFMSWIGGVFILSYILNITYQLAQINYLFLKGKMPLEVYERLATHYTSNAIVMIIVVYFFAKNTNTQNPE